MRSCRRPSLLAAFLAPLAQQPMTLQITCRELHSDEDFEQCLELQRLTWGDDFNELVPPTVMRISQKVGGVAAGAFDDAGRQLAFVWGLSGLRDGRPAHWSHMLAAHPDAQGLGLGKRLKWFQRDLLIRQGVDRMLWTYDPLVARNATLNLVRLGARPVEYVLDMYGESTGSELHSGLGTDRFIVEWCFDSVAADQGARSNVAPESDSVRPFNLDEAGRPRTFESAGTLLRPGARQLWIEVPRDIEQLKTDDRELARAYRDSLRSLIPVLFERGWRIDGVFWPAADRAWYRAVARSTEA